ncbi:MAG: UDP-N-acetylmuramate dehydrogenase [Parcubacteria group bacterium]
MSIAELELLPGIKKNVSLAPYSTFRVGGNAKYFVEPATREEIAHTFHVVRNTGLHYWILGGGSNILISDKGFDGVIVRPLNVGVHITNTQVIAEAATSLQQVIQKTAQANLSGLEHLMGIPGSLGGAIAGNAGTAKEWISSAVSQIVFAEQSGIIRTVPASECAFGYRTSRFKDTQDEVVLAAQFLLTPESQEKIRERTLQYVGRRTHQPSGNACAGCIFKNPPESPAGKLIEEAGLKGKRIGGAMVSDEHGNFIVNTGSATAEDIVILISYIKQQIRDRHGIQLKEEIKYVGF